MKLSKDFIVHSTGGESFLVPTGNAKFSGIVRGNKTINDIYECLQEETTRDEIVRKMRDKYSAPQGTIESDVDMALEKLRSIGALDE